jgi:outer membrane protein
MKKIFFLFIPGLILAGQINAQTSSQPKAESFSFSLQQAIDYAYQHQKDAVNADLDQQIADAKVKETRGIGLPQINSSLDLKNYFVENFLFPADFFPGGTSQYEPGEWIGVALKTPQYAATAGISASQILFDGTFFTALKASKTYRELSQKNLTRTRIETVVSVSKAYYNQLVNIERFDLLLANMNRLKKLKDDTQAMYDNGFVEKVDLDRVSLTYNNMNVEKENSERMLLIGEFYLKFQMGMDINSKLQLTDSLNAELVKNITLPASTDVTNRIELSLLNTQQRLLELDLQRYHSQYLPSLVLYGNLYTVAQRARFDMADTEKKWYPTGFVGASLSLPIFSGLQKHYRVEQAELSIRKMKSEIENTTNGLNLEANTSKVALENAIASFKTQEENLGLANEVVRVTKLKYDQGVGSNLEVVTAETSLREAQSNYYRSLYSALVAKVDLDKSLGNIK